MKKIFKVTIKILFISIATLTYITTLLFNITIWMLPVVIYSAFTANEDNRNRFFELPINLITEFNIYTVKKIDSI